MADAPRWLAVVSLVLATGLGLGLRLSGIDAGLPHYSEPDAELVTQVRYLRGERVPEKLASDFGTYPLLVGRVAALLPAPPLPGELDRPRTTEEHLALASARHGQVRRVAAWLSALAIPAAYALGRAFLRRSWSLVAALLAATSLLTLDFAQQARAHAPAAALVAVTLALAVRLRRRGTWGAYVAVGVAAGCAVGALHSAVAVLLAVLAAHVLREPRRLFDPRALVPVACVAAAIAAFYPFLFESATGDASAASVDGESVVQGNHLVELAWFDGRGFARVARTLWWYEPVLVVLGLVGLAAWIVGGADGGRRAPSRDALVVLSYALPYALVIGVFGETFERFVLPLIAPLAVLAAWGLARAGALLGRSRSAGFVAAASVALALVACVRLCGLRAAPDTCELAAGWIDANVQPSEPVWLAPIPEEGNLTLDLPLYRDRESLAAKGRNVQSRWAPWMRWQLRVPEAAAPDGRSLRWLTRRFADLPADARGSEHEWLRENPRGYFATSGPGLFAVEVCEGRDYVEMNGLRRALRELGTLEARISPWREGVESDLPLDWQDRDEDGGDWPHYALALFRARAIGPVIELYRVDAADL